MVNLLIGVCGLRSNSTNIVQTISDMRKGNERKGERQRREWRERVWDKQCRMFRGKNGGKVKMKM